MVNPPRYSHKNLPEVLDYILVVYHVKNSRIDSPKVDAIFKTPETYLLLSFQQFPTVFLVIYHWKNTRVESGHHCSDSLIFFRDWLYFEKTLFLTWKFQAPSCWHWRNSVDFLKENHLTNILQCPSKLSGRIHWFFVYLTLTWNYLGAILWTLMTIDDSYNS